MAGPPQSPPPTAGDLYREDVGRTVDGIVADVVGGFLTTQRACDTRARESAEVSRWAKYLPDAVDCLLSARHPSVGLTADAVHRRNERERFPFLLLAGLAFGRDCVVELTVRPEYTALPRR